VPETVIVPSPGAAEVPITPVPLVPFEHSAFIVTPMNGLLPAPAKGIDVVSVRALPPPPPQATSALAATRAAVAVAIELNLNLTCITPLFIETMKFTQTPKTSEDEIYTHKTNAPFFKWLR
jgi:hypothetical protein